MNPPSSEPSNGQSRIGKALGHPVFLCGLLVVLTVLAYWPATFAEFINYDDNDYVTANPHVLGGLTWRNVAWAFTANHASNWHPLTWLSHMVDITLFGKGPTGPHCVNLLLHVGNSLLLFLWLKQMTGAKWRSAFVAALFALHPLHVESVAWVSERKDVLSTFFGLLTLLTYVRYCKKLQLKEPHVVFCYVLTLIFYAFGLMSKPMLVTFPFVMLLLDFWPLRRGEILNITQQPRAFLRQLWEKLPFFLLSAGSCKLTTWAQQKAMQPLEYLPMTERWANSAIAYVRYLTKMIFPFDLGLPYLHPGHWPALHVMLAAAIIIGLGVGAVWTWRSQPYLFMGWFWYLGTLVPVIGLVQVGAQSSADRYTYIPLIGIFIASVWGMAALGRRFTLPRLAMGVGSILIVAGCGILTHRQAARWHDSVSLFKHSAAVIEGNFVALGNVGGALFESDHLEEALDFYQRSHQVNPRYPEAVNSIGAVLARKGKQEEAMAWFQRALELQPTHADAAFNLGNAMAKKGNHEEAVRYFRSALKIRPDNFEAHNNLGNALIKLGQLDAAIQSYQTALEYQPDAALIHKNLGEMFAAKGQLAEAIAQYRQALQFTNDPGTHYSLGLTLAVQGRWPEAIGHYETTLKTDPANAEVRYNLGYALRMNRQLEAAARQLREALQLKRDFPLAQFNLGCVLADLQRPQEAAIHLREALRLKPDYQDAQKKLQALEDPAPQP